MGESPPPATTIESLGAHIWHLQQQLAENNEMLRLMATRKDLERVQEAISGLATRSYVDERFTRLQDEIERNRPVTRLKGLAAIIGAVTVIGAAAGFMWQVVSAAQRYVDRVQHLPDQPRGASAAR